jgi:hypothetical protein
MYYICIEIFKNIVMETKSIRRQRFESVAARRVQGIIDQLESLSNCANKANYEYSDDDLRKMFTAIKEKVKNTEMAFGNALNRAEKNTFKF